jgi:DNA-binding ferritin-like protein
MGGTTLRSIGYVARTQRMPDNDADYVEPLDMLAELREDSKALAARLREVRNVCSSHHDIASARLDRDRPPYLVPVRSQPPARFRRALRAIRLCAT